MKSLKSCGYRFIPWIIPAWIYFTRGELQVHRRMFFASLNLRYPRPILTEYWMKFFVSHPRFAPMPFLLRHWVFSRWRWLKINVLRLYREHILFGSLRDAVVAAWLIATTTMDIFYNGRGGRHERLEIHLLPRETQSNPVGWEEDLAVLPYLSP